MPFQSNGTLKYLGKLTVLLSSHPEVSMVNLVSLLYYHDESATEQRTVFAQNFKSYYVNMSSTCQDFFTDVSLLSTCKKDLVDSRSFIAQ